MASNTVKCEPVHRTTVATNLCASPRWLYSGVDASLPDTDMTEAALAPNATPQPPSVILQLLEKLAVPYQVRAERPGLPAAARLQAVLLEWHQVYLMELQIVQVKQ